MRLRAYLVVASDEDEQVQNDAVPHEHTLHPLLSPALLVDRQDEYLNAQVDSYANETGQLQKVRSMRYIPYSLSRKS